MYFCFCQYDLIIVQSYKKDVRQLKWVVEFFGLCSLNKSSVRQLDHNQQTALCQH